MPLLMVLLPCLLVVLPPRVCLAPVELWGSMRLAAGGGAARGLARPAPLDHVELPHL